MLRTEPQAGTGRTALAADELDDGARACIAPLPDEVASVGVSAGTPSGRGAGSEVFTTG